MPLAQRITDDLKAAMKSGDRRRLDVLRLIKARIQEAQVEARASQGPDAELDDDEVTAIIATCAKQHRDSIESFEKAERPDLVEKERNELAVVQEYLPQPLSPEEIRGLIAEAIAETGAASPRDMGAVMKVVVPKVRGAADGKAVSQMVREMLAAR